MCQREPNDSGRHESRPGGGGGGGGGPFDGTREKINKRIKIKIKNAIGGVPFSIQEQAKRLVYSISFGAVKSSQKDRLALVCVAVQTEHATRHSHYRMMMMMMMMMVLVMIAMMTVVVVVVVVMMGQDFWFVILVTLPLRSQRYPPPVITVAPANYCIATGGYRTL